MKERLKRPKLSSAMLLKRDVPRMATAGFTIMIQLPFLEEKKTEKHLTVRKDGRTMLVERVGLRLRDLMS